MADLREMIDGPEPVLAPLVLNPLMAKLAESAGFRALYLGGGATGYMKVHLEANLTLTEMCQTAIEIGAATPLPLIFDAAAGFGDPMHMRRTIAMSEAAGFQAIEIEDQWLPKRAHHHVGIEHMVEKEIMAAEGGGGGAGEAERPPPHRRAHQRGPGLRHGRCARPRRGLSGGGRRPPAALAPHRRGSALHRGPPRGAAHVPREPGRSRRPRHRGAGDGGHGLHDHRRPADPAPRPLRAVEGALPGNGRLLRFRRPFARRLAQAPGRAARGHRPRGAARHRAAARWRRGRRGRPRAGPPTPARAPAWRVRRSERLRPRSGPTSSPPAVNRKRRRPGSACRNACRWARRRGG